MATTTTALGLTKPDFNEYFDSWGDVANANFDLIDAAVGALQTLTSGAKGAYADINARLTADEGDIADLQDLIDLRPAYTEGVPTGSAFIGPNDAADGQSDVARIFHSIGLELLELTGVAAALNIDAGVAARMAHRAQGIVSGAAGTLISFNDGTHIDVDPAGDFELLVGGKYGLIRGGESVTLEALVPAAAARYYLVATAVGWNQLAGAADGATSGSTMAGTIAGTEARAGDLVEITAGSTELTGLYVIKTIGAGTLTINGTFPKNVAGLTFRFQRRHWVTLSLLKWGTGLDAIQNGQAYLAGSLVGTVLGHRDMKSGSAVFGNGPGDPVAVQYPPDLYYDTGWIDDTTFFGGVAFTAAGCSKSLELPDTPASFQLLWSASSDGSNAVPVPNEDDAGAYGVRRYWNRNRISLVAPTAANVLQDYTGAAKNEAAVQGGYFRMIAKG